MFEWFQNTFFKNAGSRIRRMAVILFMVEFVCAILAAAIATFSMFIMLVSGEYDEGALFLVTPLSVFPVIGAAWLFTLPLYGFGELLEKVYKIEKNTRDDSDVKTGPDSITEEPEQEEAPPERTWLCNCGMRNVGSAKTCCGCGKKYPKAKYGNDGYIQCSCGAMVQPGVCPLCGAEVK